jgi:hypothetical protein
MKPAEGGQGTSSAATRAKTLFYTQVRRKRNLPATELIVDERNAPFQIAFAESADRD